MAGGGGISKAAFLCRYHPCAPTRRRAPPPRFLSKQSCFPSLISPRRGRRRRCAAGGRRTRDPRREERNQQGDGGFVAKSDTVTKAKPKLARIRWCKSGVSRGVKMASVEPDVTSSGADRSGVFTSYLPSDEVAIFYRRITDISDRVSASRCSKRSKF